MAYSITLSLNYNFHDCVPIDTALLDVMYVEIEDATVLNFNVHDV